MPDKDSPPLIDERTLKICDIKLRKIKAKMTQDIHPSTLTASMRDSIVEHFAVLSACSSVGLEDFPGVTHHQTAALLKYGDRGVQLPRETSFALEGYFAADLLTRVKSRNARRALTVDDIKEINALVMGRGERMLSTGEFRKGGVILTGSSYSPPSPVDVPARMDAWLARYTAAVNEETIDPVMAALNAHLAIVHIHPFTDGNGRTARLVQNGELAKHGYPPIIIPENQRGLYLKHMDTALHGKPVDLYEFLLSNLSRTMDEMKRVVDVLRGVPEKDPGERS